MSSRLLAAYKAVSPGRAKARRVVGFRKNGGGSGFAVRQMMSDAKLAKAKCIINTKC